MCAESSPCCEAKERKEDAEREWARYQASGVCVYADNPVCMSFTMHTGETFELKQRSSRVRFDKR